MKKNYQIFLLFLVSFIILSVQNIFSQNNVGIGTRTPHKNAILEMQATDRGILIPRMNTSDRLQIVMGPDADGMLVYDTEYHKFMFWNGQLLMWMPIRSGSETSLSAIITTISRNGSESRAGNSASGTQTILHGLGVIPKKVRLKAIYDYNSSEIISSDGSFDGSNQNCVSYDLVPGNSTSFVNSDRILNLTSSTGDSQIAIISVDPVNIYLNWVKTGNPTSNFIRILWEADGF